LLDQRLAAKPRRRLDPLHDVERSGERVDHRWPEPLRIPLTALNRHSPQPIP
jgi:hypothetical protein